MRFVTALFARFTTMSFTFGAASLKARVRFTSPLRSSFQESLRATACWDQRARSYESTMLRSFTRNVRGFIMMALATRGSLNPSWKAMSPPEQRPATMNFPLVVVSSRKSIAARASSRPSRG